MTGFEQFLISKGYLKFVFNCKTMSYESTSTHELSTMTNLDHRYFHKDDKKALDFINSKISVLDKSFTLDIRKGEIFFGLHEAHKPPTLIHPRPKIRVKQPSEIKPFMDERFDDAVNIVFSKYSFDEIFEAMYDSDKVLFI